jgi:outer membrane protein assembly factor BamA
VRRFPAVRAVALVLVLTAVPAAAPEAQPVRVSPDAEVRSLGFRFEGPHEVQAEDLKPLIATHGPVWGEWAWSAVAWIPFVGDPPPRPFRPVTLQEDVVRLRHHYRRHGFLESRVGYELDVDRRGRQVGVTFVVGEGPPLMIRSMTTVDAAGRASLGLDPELQSSFAATWRQVTSRHVGGRFREADVNAIEAGIREALSNNGYPAARIEPMAAIDSLAHEVDLRWTIAIGPRVRISSIAIEGVKSVDQVHVTRQLPFQSGDWFSLREVERGRANLQSVALFRQTDIARDDPVDSSAGAGADPTDDPPDGSAANSNADSPPDSGGASSAADTAAVLQAPLALRVSIAESRPRFTNLEAGYVTDGAGVTAQARWTHPNFTGGARSLDVLGLVQTGWGTTSDVPDRLARASLSLTQPYVGSPSLSLAVGPALEVSDGRIDASTSYSGLATLVRRLNPLQSVALRYDFTYRQLRELNVAGLEGGVGNTIAVRAVISPAFVDSLEQPVRISQFILFTSLGALDDISRPRHGLIVKPNLAITFPAVFGNVEFARADIQGTVFTPFPGRANALMLRGTLGGLWPFGASVPSAGATPAFEWIRLRDQVLTAGGANDVRGYEGRMLGPKFPDVEPQLVNGDTVLTAERYFYLGGLRRFTGSAELRLKPPRSPPNVFAHLFADAGRVWTPDERFRLGAVAPDAERVFFTTGGGIGYYTPVGAIRFDVGYKLNPSVYDLRKPGDVLAALQAGQPAENAPIDKWRRYGFHLALGLFF